MANQMIRRKLGRPYEGISVLDAAKLADLIVNLGSTYSEIQEDLCDYEGYDHDDYDDYDDRISEEGRKSDPENDARFITGIRRKTSGLLLGLRKVPWQIRKKAKEGNGSATLQFIFRGLPELTKISKKGHNNIRGNIEEEIISLDTATEIAEVMPSVYHEINEAFNYFDRNNNLNCNFQNSNYSDREVQDKIREVASDVMSDLERIPLQIRNEAKEGRGNRMLVEVYQKLPQLLDYAENGAEILRRNFITAGNAVREKLLGSISEEFKKGNKEIPLRYLGCNNGQKTENVVYPGFIGGPHVLVKRDAMRKIDQDNPMYLNLETFLNGRWDPREGVARNSYVTMRSDGQTIVEEV